jgi:hypothetical protein
MARPATVTVSILAASVAAAVLHSQELRFGVASLSDTSVHVDSDDPPGWSSWIRATP